MSSSVSSRPSTAASPTPEPEARTRSPNPNPKAEDRSRTRTLIPSLILTLTLSLTPSLSLTPTQASSVGGGVPLSAAAHRQWSEREVQAYVLAEQIARLHADALGRRRAAHPHQP